MSGAHAHDPEFLRHHPDGQVRWLVGRPGDPIGAKRCSFCGSVDVVTFLGAIMDKTRWDYEAAPSKPGDLRSQPGVNEVYLEYADWKYGWPHKLYFGAGSLKFYTSHLQDLGRPDFDATVAEMHRLLPEVRWARGDDGRVTWTWIGRH